MNTRSGPFTMTSLIESSRNEVLDGLQRTAGSFRIRSLELSFGRVDKVRIVRVVVCGFR